ncbi:hypothetical protein [Mycobacterium persicum]|uniref:PE family immunomodulator PE5 n=1 Tax=Mycobacterium persicum TaxID=1487726 RepID=A0A1X0LA76_9MYCO|nr:hypothetical protein [Mycobacterium persicum]KZS85631.1 hypothetical protein A4G31_10375 [Mycobacterium persicum]ORB51938.1 hypothetical protein BST40_09955 [Mycobacterium persicum]ORB89648.1 hypothetical protein B1T49_10900 [Mycobacterium persicum]ORB95093.1 hypothetical protein B1T44_11895 [Mycobacterium persicum]ORC01835.1 hypothetical protein B1T48_11665 [Mycobacterium persicum]
MTLWVVPEGLAASAARIEARSAQLGGAHAAAGLEQLARSEAPTAQGSASYAAGDAAAAVSYGPAGDLA